MAKANQEAVLGQPQWTSKAEKRGLDPLGMQTTSVALYQLLLPGISNVTLRMRYYGLYAWLAQRYARDIHDASVDRWCLYLRRAEALYALVATYSGGERGVAGVDWASRVLATGPSDQLVFHPGTDRGEGEPQYLKQKFGAFGAAYGSQLVDIGVLEVVPGHGIPLPTADTGERIADAFAAAVGDAAAVFLAAADAGSVAKADLKRMHPMLPSKIAGSGLERSLYEELLFVGHRGQGWKAESRGKTLRLVLRSAKNSGGSVGVNDLRWKLYATQWGGPNALDSLPEDEVKQQFAWAAYQANDLFHICYETILKVALDILGASPTGMPLETLVETTVVELQTALANQHAATWNGLLASVQVAADATARSEAGSEFSLERVAFKISRPEVVDSGDSARSALLLLAVLHKRFRGLIPRLALELPVLASESFLQSVVTEIRFLDAHADEPLRTLLARIVKQRVLDRHLWVALQKFRGQGDYTFLLEADEGRVRLRQKDGPVQTNPRLSSAVAFMQDIHLLGKSGPTADGLRLIEAA